jgi:hypothetical protein
MNLIRPLIPVCLLSALTVINVSAADAQTKIRNFNLNCGLIGKFVRYPPHLQHCKALVVCGDRRVCRKKKSIAKLPAAPLALSDLKLDEQTTGAPDGPSVSTPGNTDSPGSTNSPGASTDDSGGLGIGASVNAGVTGGGVSAGAGGGASVGSGSGNNASVGAVGGASVGGTGVSAGGSLGVGGL